MNGTSLPPVIIGMSVVSWELAYVHFLRLSPPSVVSIWRSTEELR
jgi:hypothetical protein